MFDYAGCIHFHSHYSYDSQVGLQEIIDAGLNAGLDYAVLTDHFRLDARKEGWEGFHPSPLKPGRSSSGLLLIVGEEISPRYNHYLALGTQTPVVIEKIHPKAQPFIDAVNAQGGFGFIAHPDHQGAPLVGVRAYPWIEWEAQGFAGMSIWDLIGDWSSHLTSRLNVLRAVLMPGHMITGPQQRTLKRWDELTQKGHYAAIGEIDNHDGIRSYFGIKKRVFPFAFAFRTIRTHVLLEQPLQQSKTDIPLILSALRQGQSYVSLDLWKDPQGFSFEIYDADRRATMGGQFDRRKPAILDVKIPDSGRLRVIRNGQTIWQQSGKPYLQQDVDIPGVYRIEVDQKVGGRWRPWIFSNPIWVNAS